MEMHVQDYDLAMTLDSGQHFGHWIEDEWHVVHDGARVFRVRQEGETLYYSGIDRCALEAFLGIGYDYSGWVSDDALDRARDACLGLHLLRQDSWQCMVGFVISQNNNISRIRKSIRAIIDGQGGFPGPGEMQESVLREAGLGYRLKYLIALNELSRSDISEMEGMSYTDLRERLMGLSGIGPKVADCICLFGFSKYESFPVDTWIAKIMNHLYLEDASLQEVRAYGMEKFGSHAGLAQQFLFHYARKHLNKEL